MTHSTLSGVLPVISTPFDARGAIDDGALRHELNWVLDHGVSGITVGMVSEVMRLGDDERQHLDEMVVSVCAARQALSVVSCGSESVERAVSLARHAQDVGASALMAIAPVTVALDDDGQFGYFRDLLCATRIPMVVQDASGYVGRPLSLGVMTRLLDEFGDRVYFKPEAQPLGQRLSALRDTTAGRARVFEGTGGVALVDSYRRGVVGTMPGAEVCWAVVALWRALQAGEWALAYEISGPLALLIDLQTSLDSYVAVEKHILWRQGVLASTAARGPTSYDLDDETRDEIDRLVDRLSSAARPT